MIKKMLVALALVATGALLPLTATAETQSQDVCSGSYNTHAAGRALYRALYAGHVNGGTHADWYTDNHGQFRFSGGYGVPFWYDLHGPNGQGQYEAIASAVIYAACK